MSIKAKIKDWCCGDDIEGLQTKIKALEVSKKAIALELDSIKKNPNTPSTFIAEPIFYENPVTIDYFNLTQVMGSGKILTILDTHSYGIDYKDVRKIIDANPSIRDMKYIANDLDCDDFAIALYGLFNQQTLGRFCFGLARSKSHAFNFFIDRSKKLWIIEPQNGIIMDEITASRSNMDYTITHYIV